MDSHTSDPSFWSAMQIATAIQAKKISASECLDHYLDRVSKFNDTINAIVVVDEEHARERALTADNSLHQKNTGPLHGVPITVKEAYDVAGMPTTWGYESLKQNIPHKDALTVQRLKNAGAVLFGKTNVPVGLADWQPFNPIYGTTNNPWDTSRGPGGSSGGSAAALAAGLTALEAGSDIGASIRNPSHYCGTYGHKPTFGVVSDQGHRLPDFSGTPYTDIAVVGPMARSADDLALALSIMAGPDENTSTGWQLALPSPKKQSLKEFRIGVIYSDPIAEVDIGVQEKIQDVVRFLRDAGTDVMEDYKPTIDSEEAFRTYISLLRAATSTSVGESTISEFERSNDGTKPNVGDYEGLMRKAVRMKHRDWLFINETRHRMRLAWDAYFEGVDLFLCPAATTVAFPHNQQGERWERMVNVNGKPQPTTTALFWAGYSGHVYLPSTVAPIGLSTHRCDAPGLPVGIQIVGPQYHDYRCIRFAQLLEQQFYKFAPPPDFR